MACDDDGRARACDDHTPPTATLTQSTRGVACVRHSLSRARVRVSPGPPPVQVDQDASTDWQVTEGTWAFTRMSTHGMTMPFLVGQENSYGLQARCRAPCFARFVASSWFARLPSACVVRATERPGPCRSGFVVRSLCARQVRASSGPQHDARPASPRKTVRCVSSLSARAAARAVRQLGVAVHPALGHVLRHGGHADTGGQGRDDPLLLQQHRARRLGLVHRGGITLHSTPL